MLGRVAYGHRMTVALDTLKAFRRLTAAGFDESQADALVGIFAEDVGAGLATKDDLTNEMAMLRTEIHTEMAMLRTEMHTEIAALRAEMHTEIATLRADMKDLERRLTIRMGAMVGGGVTILLAALSIITAIILTA